LKLTANGAEYVTAPLAISPSEIDGFGEAGGDDAASGTWWYPNRDRTVYRDVDASIRFLQGVFEQQGPFDGVLGFSQGAAMAALLCSLRGRDGYAWVRFRFAVLVSGMGPRGRVDVLPAPAARGLREGPRTLPAERRHARLQGARPRPRKPLRAPDRRAFAARPRRQRRARQPG
jgi:hypothetical protein